MLTPKADPQSLPGRSLLALTRFRTRAWALICKLPLGPGRWLPDLAQCFPERSGRAVTESWGSICHAFITWGVRIDICCRLCLGAYPVMVVTIRHRMALDRICATSDGSPKMDQRGLEALRLQGKERTCFF
ncbi:hypothetical protein CERZMDRAFT_90260 [Cercospora zeae-maydis SCOH1-5]|uniref:Uncharacterized protein n=1 Tax=Cercospora zeae-maydis SCOH1-5 TaxID=717836 RepID=A0A6A6FNG2_9PEZI|nr:hypothetical protein CERZMDRAFT_90260 [Cercospora zeae-maydis SCOH1-5]